MIFRGVEFSKCPRGGEGVGLRFARRQFDLLGLGACDTEHVPSENLQTCNSSRAPTALRVRAYAAHVHRDQENMNSFAAVTANETNSVVACQGETQSYVSRCRVRRLSFR